MSKYTDAVERNLAGLDAVSTGTLDSCTECEDATDEGSFSWHGCGICDSRLGGEKYIWHGVNQNGQMIHFGGACEDCVMYLANGDEPDEPEEDDESEEDAEEETGR